MLFAVATGGPIAAIAGPASPTSTPTVAVAPLVQPRTLQTGAPACGNVLWKMTYFPDPACGQQADGARTIITQVNAIIEQAREIGRAVAAFDGFGDRALTVAEARRPGS